VSKFSSGFDNNTGAEMVNATDAISSLFGDLTYMMYNRMRIGCELPYSNFFIDEVFSSYDTIDDTLSVEGYLSFIHQKDRQFKIW
jgi:hypothetical protein